jgi:hypothetical protein
MHCRDIICSSCFAAREELVPLHLVHGAPHAGGRVPVPEDDEDPLREGARLRVPRVSGGTLLCFGSRLANLDLQARDTWICRKESRKEAWVCKFSPIARPVSAHVSRHLALKRTDSGGLPSLDVS